MMQEENMMKTWTAAAAALATFGSPVSAQGSSGPAPASAQASAGLTLKIAPTLGDSLPLELADGLNDYKNTTSLLLNAEAPIGPLAWEAQAGIKVAHNLNDPEKDASSLVFNNAVRLYRGFRRFSPFVYGNLEIAYANFLDESAGETFEYGAGAKVELLSGTFDCPGILATDECFAKSAESMSLALTAQAGRSDNSDDTKDYWGPKVGISYFQRFARNRLILKVDAEYEHKRFDEPRPTRRRDDQLVLAAGIDFARWIFPTSPGIKTLQLGGRWVRSWSNDVDGQANKLQFLPVLSIGTSF
jgi:hypothetical protein